MSGTRLVTYARYARCSPGYFSRVMQEDRYMLDQHVRCIRVGGCVKPGERRHQADAQCRLSAEVRSSVTSRVLVSFGDRRVVVARERASGSRRVRHRLRAVAWSGIHFFGGFPILVGRLETHGGQRRHDKKRRIGLECICIYAVRRCARRGAEGVNRVTPYRIFPGLAALPWLAA